LLDALELDRVRLIAHDWGALIGFQLCLHNPHRVEKYLSLSTPHPYIRLNPHLVPAMRHLWFQEVIATPALGSTLLRAGNQELARYIFRSFTHERDAWSKEDIELFLAPLREPARARAGSALYRGFILPEVVRILRGAYRGTHLSTPTRLLCGAQDPLLRPELLGGHEEHADDLRIELIDGARHFLVDEKPDAVVERALTFFAKP
jgi:pimeloyl-ACP methyl ester carboxylesterase